MEFAIIVLLFALWLFVMSCSLILFVMCFFIFYLWQKIIFSWHHFSIHVNIDDDPNQY